ncbi:MAG: DUF4837 family protein [Gemmatimonas sp.]|nr:DUF4837 family protein [Gemmatimonas sp.]
MTARIRIRSRHERSWATFALGLMTLIVGCEKPRSMGDTNQILVASTPGVWSALEPDIKRSLEPQTFTVRNERVFDVAHTDPSEEGWASLQILRQILVIGTANDPTVARVLEAYNRDVPPPPSVIQVRNLWAQDQLVTLALLPEGEEPTIARPLVEALGRTYLDQFEEYARARMFVTGAHEELRDSLQRNAGFGLTLPRVYRYAQLDSTVYLFRNDQPDPSQLIRNVTVDSRPNSEGELDAETAAQWRAELAEQYTHPPQVTDTASEGQSMQLAERPALQIHGIWSNPPNEWPAAGPFIARLIRCPDRTFLVDAWLYAPGVAKYEYMYQLNTVLNSFTCASG